MSRRRGVGKAVIDRGVENTIPEAVVCPLRCITAETTCGKLRKRRVVGSEFIDPAVAPLRGLAICSGTPMAAFEIPG
jgi:hypothetical protein